MNKTELHAFVSGLVQGVGFRSILRKFALEYALTGFARNLEDGRVEFLVQGPKTKIEEFLRAIKSHPGACRIDSIDENWQAPKQSFPAFEILR